MCLLTFVGGPVWMGQHAASTVTVRVGLLGGLCIAVLAVHSPRV